ncbi:MAG: hypothetical protein M3N54_08345, partial [Acidobacteriota bacterium]|nr:hypothetical protein [Acidobacteriota bacterium]
FAEGRMNTRNSRRGGILSGLLLTALGIVVLIVVAGVFVARNVRVMTSHRGSGDDVSIDIPGGHVNVRARHGGMNAASLGIPSYPGATQQHDGGGAAFEWISNDGKEDKGIAVSGAELFTTDSAAQVLRYYRTQLPGWIVVTERDGSTRFEMAKNGYKRIVGIREKRDGTHIGVATIGEPASN